MGVIKNTPLLLHFLSLQSLYFSSDATDPLGNWVGPWQDRSSTGLLLFGLGVSISREFLLFVDIIYLSDLSSSCPDMWGWHKAPMPEGTFLGYRNRNGGAKPEA